MEKVNTRYPFELPEQVDFLVADVSFISLTMALPEPLTHLRAGGYAVTLIKPQFEARRGEVGKGGIIRDDTLRADILKRGYRLDARPPGNPAAGYHRLTNHRRRWQPGFPGVIAKGS